MERFTFITIDIKTAFFSLLVYFLLCYDINFYLFEGMSQQLNLNSGYYANNGKGRSHPYHCTPLYRQYSDAMMSTPSTGQKTNLFSRAARHIRHALPGQERTDRSSWWPTDGRRTDVFDRELRNATRTPSIFRDLEDDYSENFAGI